MKKHILLSVLSIGGIFISNAQSDILTYGDYDKNSFNRLSIGYDDLFLNNGFSSMDGVNLTYIHGFKIIEKPLFIEIGVSVSYNTRSYVGYESTEQDYDGYIFNYDRDKRLNSLSARIPVSVSYNIKLAEKFSIQPFTGINFKVNPIFDYEYASSNWGYDENNNYFDSGIWEKADNNLFQLGWQIGVGFNFSRLYLGIQYGVYFMNRATINKESYSYSDYSGYDNNLIDSYSLKSSHLLVSLGINF